MIEGLLSNIQGTFVFLIVLSVLIVVHEWGHFITAKKLGVDVHEFALGFGPTLYAKFYNGTNYMVKLFPLGGYVKMAGDDRTKCKGTPEEFYSKSPGHRSLIVLNGPVVNFVLAYICFVFVFMLGFPDLSTKVGQLVDDYPAKEAGLLVGDQIVRINENPIDTWTDLQNGIKESTTTEIEVEIVREGATLIKSIKPIIEDRENIFGQKQTIRMIGIVPAQDMITVKYGFGESFGLAYKKLEEITVMTYKAIYYMITGSMSAKQNVTGPIGIFVIVKSAAELGFSHLLYIVGVISASLAIFNLLPIVPLDGGHLFFTGIEKILGRPLPKKVDEFILKLGLSVFLFLVIFVFYSDFARFDIFDKLKQLIP